MIKAIILDLDGTVGYTMPELQKSINETLRFFGYPERTLEELYQWVNLHSRAWITGCVPEGATEAQITEAHKKYNEIYGKYYLDTEYYPGVEALLHKWISEGYPVCMMSNKSHDHVVGLAKKLSRIAATADDPADQTNFGQVGIFTCAWGVSDRFPPKPAPDSSLAIAEMLGLHPSEIAFIGDSEVDVNTARNAGMVQISVTWGYRPRAFHEQMGVVNLADTPDELDALIHNPDIR
ncbi:MAG: HAD family hydrolase [Clostridia bacterium]|nr:HAD family hydrolase [Clostridia bacterium]